MHNQRNPEIDQIGQADVTVTSSVLRFVKILDRENDVVAAAVDLGDDLMTKACARNNAKRLGVVDPYPGFGVFREGI